MGADNRVSIIYSNLQKAAEKQQNADLVSDYGVLSEKYREPGRKEGTLSDLQYMSSKDLSEIIPRARETVTSRGDRGGQRALKWGETVTKIQKSLLDRFIGNGDEAFEGKDFYVCQACGFIYVGKDIPKICAACKAPASRFEKIR